MNGRNILNYLNAKDEFWYWGVNNIDVQDQELSFRVNKLKHNPRIVIAMQKSGFKVQQIDSGLLGQKVTRSFRNVAPMDLADVITDMVFASQQTA